MIIIKSVCPTGEIDRTYELRKTLLFDKNKYYWRTLKRSEIRKIFRDRISSTYFNSYNEDGTIFIEHGSTRVAQSSGILQIGCQRFVGKDLEKLRRWALQKRRKSGKSTSK